MPYRLEEDPLALYKNCKYAHDRQGQVNHITGEVYYIAMALKRKNTLLTIHDVDSLVSKNKLKNLILHIFWLYLPVKRVSRVTVVSAYSKRKLIEATGVASSKVRVIPNCVPFTVSDFQPKLHINKQEPILLQVGTKANKNLKNLVAAISGIPSKLLIIGKLSEEQVQLLVANRINYRTYQNLSYDEVKNLYYAADIVTFVSTFEGFGLPIVEANALGRPVITSTTSAMPEVAGEGALLVDPYNPVEIREAIEKLVGDDQFRSKMVAAGYENAKRFKPESVAAMYEELYAEIMEESR